MIYYFLLGSVKYILGYFCILPLYYKIVTTFEQKINSIFSSTYINLGGGGRAMGEGGNGEWYFWFVAASVVDATTTTTTTTLLLQLHYYYYYY